MPTIVFSLFAVLSVLQLIIILYLYASPSSKAPKKIILNENPERSNSDLSASMKTSSLDTQYPLQILPTKKYAGVAACLTLHAATWFQRRYTAVVRNIRANIPDDWIVQIFYTAKGQSQNGIDINIGLQRMIEDGSVILTLIPESVTSRKKKLFELWTEGWIWNNMLADRVLVFEGNSAICGNSPFTFESFSEWDYIGR